MHLGQVAQTQSVDDVRGGAGTLEGTHRASDFQEQWYVTVIPVLPLLGTTAQRSLHLERMLAPA